MSFIHLKFWWQHFYKQMAKLGDSWHLHLGDDICLCFRHLSRTLGFCVSGEPVSSASCSFSSASSSNFSIFFSFLLLPLPLWPHPYALILFSSIVSLSFHFLLSLPPFIFDGNLYRPIMKPSFSLSPSPSFSSPSFYLHCFPFSFILYKFGLEMGAGIGSETDEYLWSWFSKHA